jgi:hypothetical protein
MHLQLCRLPADVDAHPAYNCPRDGAQGGHSLSDAKENQASERREAPPSIRAPIRIGAVQGAALTLAWYRTSVRSSARGAPLGQNPDWLPAVAQFGGGVFIQFSPEALSKWLSRPRHAGTFSRAGASGKPGAVEPERCSRSRNTFEQAYQAYVLAIR